MIERVEDTEDMMGTWPEKHAMGACSFDVPVAGVVPVGRPGVEHILQPIRVWKSPTVSVVMNWLRQAPRRSTSGANDTQVRDV